MKKLIYLIQFLIIPAPLFFFNLFELKLNNELFVNLLNNYAIFSAFTPIIATF